MDVDYTLDVQNVGDIVMQICCFVCRQPLGDGEIEQSVVLKIKGGDDAFIFQHWKCWIEHGRFRHYDIDFDYLMLELEARAHSPKKK